MKRIFSIFLVFCLAFTGMSPSLAKQRGSLKVVKTSPAAKKKKVKIKPTIKVRFNKKVTKGKKFSKILLKGKKKVAVNVKIKGKQLVVKPKKKLQNGTRYTLKLPKGAVRYKKLNNKAFKLVFTTKKKRQTKGPEATLAPTAEATATPTPESTPTAAPTERPTQGPTPTPAITPTPTPTGPRIMVPMIVGDWWRIADDDPDLSPDWEIVNDIKNVCDFTIFQSDDGKWHAIACVRGTNYVPGERLFFHWRADKITDRDWEEVGVFSIPHEIGSPADGIQYGSLQAPHCVKKDGKYFMFYNSYGGYCLTSDDGSNWKTDGVWNRMPSKSGGFKQFDMGRDVMVFDNTERDGLYYAYYCGKADDYSGGDCFTYRTATSLEGPWSTAALSARTLGNPESPFVLYRNGYYYLWQQSDVYVSDDPTDFDKEPLTKMWDWYYAPEIIEHEGQYYAAAYNNGLFITKMDWVESGERKPEIYRHSTSAGKVGVEYSATYGAHYGEGEITWEIIGKLPEGLALTSDKGYEVYLRGIPTEAGTFPLTLKVTDGKGNTHSVNVTLTVNN